MNATVAESGPALDHRTAPEVPAAIPKIRSLPERGNVIERETNGDDEPAWPFWTWFIENPRCDRGAR